jgi:hypothetical protein
MRHVILLSLFLVAVTSDISSSKTFEIESDAKQYGWQPGTENANMFEIEVDANQSSVEGRLGITRAFGDSGTLLYGGINVINSDDEDYTVGGLSLSVGNKVLSEMLRLDIGFKGLWGTMKQQRMSGDVMAAAFLFSFLYDIPGVEVFYDVPLDFELSGNVCIAPDSLSFGDADNYTEYRISLGLNILGDKIGTLLVGYRGIKAEFGEDRTKWDLSDNAVFGGLKFSF